MLTTYSESWITYNILEYYDYTEFIFYVGGVWLAYFVNLYYKKIITGLSLWSFLNLVIWLAHSSDSEESFNADRKGYFFPFSWSYFYRFEFHSFLDAFQNYDFSEFIVYVGGAWLCFFLYNLLNNKKGNLG